MKKNKELAEKIAEKIFQHARKHLNRPKQKEEWLKLGVSDDDASKRHIIKTLLYNETKMLIGINGLTHFYNASSNTYILDNATGFKGTCFLPMDKQKYIEQSVLINENLNRGKQNQTKFQKVNLRLAKRQRVINELRLNKNEITLKPMSLINIKIEEKAEEKIRLERERQRIKELLKSRKNTIQNNRSL